MRMLNITLLAAICLLFSTAAIADSLSDCPVSKMLVKCPEMTVPEDSRRITANAFINGISKVADNLGGILKATSCQKTSQSQYRIDMEGSNPLIATPIKEIYEFQVKNDYAVLSYVYRTKEFTPYEIEFFCHRIITAISWR